MTRETLTADIVDRLPALAADSKINAHDVIATLIKQYEDDKSKTAVARLTREYRQLDEWHEAVKLWPAGDLRDGELSRICEIKAMIAKEVSAL